MGQNGTFGPSSCYNVEGVASFQWRSSFLWAKQNNLKTYKSSLSILNWNNLNDKIKLTCAIPSAKAVLPDPGPPANSNALPAILRDRIRSTTMPHASRARSCPTSPAPMGEAMPVAGSNPNPLMCVCADTRLVLVVDFTSSIYEIRATVNNKRERERERAMSWATVRNLRAWFFKNIDRNWSSKKGGKKSKAAPGPFSVLSQQQHRLLSLQIERRCRWTKCFSPSLFRFEIQFSDGCDMVGLFSTKDDGVALLCRGAALCRAIAHSWLCTVCTYWYIENNRKLVLLLS